jgi:pimeloyl-ACP methyl ester carboxylesterase
MWAKVSPLLHDAGLRTFAPDQRGYSPGARPRSRFAYRIKALTDDVAALADVVGEPVHLAGHDWGSGVAWLTAAHHPERVASLTAISVGHPRAWAEAFALGDQARRSSYIATFQGRRAIRLLSRRDGRGERLLRAWGMDDAMLERFDREMIGDGALRGGLNWYRALPLGASHVFSNVRVPTTYLWSDQDVTMSASMAQRSERYVDAPYEFITLTGVKHFIPNERPDDVADAIIKRVQSVEN